MLKHIEQKDFENAIVHLMQNEKNLSIINFIAEIIERAKMFRETRESLERRNQQQLLPKNLIPKEKLKKLVKDFVKTLGDIPKDAI